MASAATRPSTTVLLVRDGPGGLEVLMVVRPDDRSQYAAAMVFPGGVLEPEDADSAWLELCEGAEGLEDAERARRIAGYRELWEETGLLLGGGQPHAASGSASAPFRDIVRESGGRLDLAAMIPFAHWITPEGAPKRYDTFFRLCGLEAATVPVCDGAETVAVEWLRPADALALGAAGERNLLFPTKCQLELLGQSASVADAVAAARARTIVPVSPRIARGEEGTVLSIPPEAGYPVCEFRMAHR
jgi:8-oxo-dGTP pyrophosphatase MutT (NUDIX family)